MELGLRVLPKSDNVGPLPCSAGLGAGSIFTKQYDAHRKHLQTRAKKKPCIFYLRSLRADWILVGHPSLTHCDININNTSIGIFFAGIAGQYTTWGWFFWIGMFLSLITATTSYFYIPSDIKERRALGIKMEIGRAHV